eukprot:gnl/TRDRNA2_/TRDRNA2_81328_c0_seq1.p1 gnl/TRDRNA2_/TRDRNA2_81328_c0~~gnl/TRDRNA2_/TRDRNA2_81328_c0_seq1.p1  ORF type:complete len:477 (-),score=35.76 gnl/TRDRNA2_/TRDRNA2_81328_c0_seq1:132-1562(-)
MSQPRYSLPRSRLHTSVPSISFFERDSPARESPMLQGGEVRATSPTTRSPASPKKIAGKFEAKVSLVGTSAANGAVTASANGAVAAPNNGALAAQRSTESFSWQPPKGPAFPPLPWAAGLPSSQSPMRLPHSQSPVQSRVNIQTAQVISTYPVATPLTNYEAQIARGAHDGEKPGLSAAGQPMCEPVQVCSTSTVAAQLTAQLSAAFPTNSATSIVGQASAASIVADGKSAAELQAVLRDAGYSVLAEDFGTAGSRNVAKIPTQLLEALRLIMTFGSAKDGCKVKGSPRLQHGTPTTVSREPLRSPSNSVRVLHSRQPSMGSDWSRTYVGPAMDSEVRSDWKGTHITGFSTPRYVGQDTPPTHVIRFRSAGALSPRAPAQAPTTVFRSRSAATAPQAATVSMQQIELDLSSPQFNSWQPNRVNSTSRKGNPLTASTGHTKISSAEAAPPPKPAPAPAHERAPIKTPRASDPADAIA